MTRAAYVENATRVHKIHLLLLPVKIALLATIPAIIVLKWIIKAKALSRIFELICAILSSIVYIVFALTMMYHLRCCAGPKALWRSAKQPYSKRPMVPISTFEAGVIFWFLAGGCVAAVFAAVPILRQYIFHLF
jgi:hypothetical protein